VLAAGTSSRWGEDNKLLTPIGGAPMIRRSVEAATQADVGPVVVVTGHEAETVAAALAGLPVAVVLAPDYAQGMSASLKAGVAAAPADCAGVLICLGDMPFIAGTTYQRLVEAFDPTRGWVAVLPTFEGRRGNPVLLNRVLFPEIVGLSGDQGARRLLAQHADKVLEVAVDDPGVLRDFDRPESFG